MKKHYFLFFSFNKLEAIILDISLASAKTGSTIPCSVFIPSRIKHNHYLVSFADFKEMSRYLMKSLLELAD